MEVIPAIDLMEQTVVRLIKGDPKTKKEYSHFGDPINVAKKWENEGANALHIIDLDAAFGRGNNLDVITELVRAVSIPIQVGGGIRSKNKAIELFELGIDRIILGTLPFRKPNELTYLLKNYGEEKVVVALDYFKSEVMIKGWNTPTETTLDEAVKKFLKFDVKLFLLTSISGDGLLTGPDYHTLEKMVQYNSIEIFAAGGVSCLGDLIRLKHIGIKGVIVGKALYEKRFNFREAVIASELSGGKRLS